MEYSKRFYGNAVIDSSDSEELQSDYKIELEYYEIENINETSKPYGIEIIKRDVQNSNISIEDKIISNICYKKQDNDKLLEKLILNKVTPISVEDIIQDLTKIKAI